MSNENEAYNAGYADGAADERERIAQAIEGRAEAFTAGSHYWFALQRAARIARNGGRDE